MFLWEETGEQWSATLVSLGFPLLRTKKMAIKAWWVAGCVCQSPGSVFFSPSFSCVPLLVSLSIYSLSIPLFIFLRPCSLRRNKENSFYSGSSFPPSLFLSSSLFFLLFVFFSRFYKAREHGNQGEPRSSMRPTICSYRSPAETVLSDEEGGAFDSETTPFTTGNGNFHFGPWILESFVIKPLVKL